MPGDTLAANVTLTQTLSGLGVAGTATSSQGACTISRNRLVTCNLGPLAPNASADVQVTFTPSVGGYAEQRHRCWIGAAGLEPGRQRRDAHDDGDGRRP